MLVSILIGTRNRAENLRQTLLSMAKLVVPDGMQVELIVVDNGSTDSTAQVVQEAVLQNVRLRYVREDRPGVSHAKNRGLRESSGEIILFTDDDVRPPENWIQAMCSPMLQGTADAVGGGIRVAPHLRRRWLVEGFPGFCASLESQKQLKDGMFFGANMGISRHVLEKVPGFDVELGPGALGFGEETLFSLQLLDAGYRILAVRDAEVEHHFEPIRLQAASAVETAKKMGRSEAYTHYHWHQGNLFNWRWWHETRASTIYALNRLIRPSRWACKENVPYWRLRPIIAYWFVKQYFIERKKPRAYSR